MNTPQFDWCRTTLPNSPQPLGKVYQPELMAQAILWAADSGRRETYPTLSSVMAIWGDQLVPGLLDHYVAHAAFEGQQSAEPVRADRPDNLFAPAARSAGARGRFDAIARSRSASWWINRYRLPLLAAGVALLALSRRK